MGIQDAIKNLERKRDIVAIHHKNGVMMLPISTVKRLGLQQPKDSSIGLWNGLNMYFMSTPAYDTWRRLQQFTHCSLEIEEEGP